MDQLGGEDEVPAPQSWLDRHPRCQAACNLEEVLTASRGVRRLVIEEHGGHWLNLVTPAIAGQCPLTSHVLPLAVVHVLTLALPGLRHLSIIIPESFPSDVRLP